MVSEIRQRRTNDLLIYGIEKKTSKCIEKDIGFVVTRGGDLGREKKLEDCDQKKQTSSYKKDKINSRI